MGSHMYGWVSELLAAMFGTGKLAELALRVANGTRPQDITVENAPDVPMFDWRQLRRWGISEDRLPPGSVINSANHRAAIQVAD